MRVEFRYQGKGELRVVEPYSLRHARSTGNLLLHTFDIRRNAHRSFKVAEIRDVRVTQDSFVPRYPVEFLATGGITVRESATRVSYTFRQPLSRPQTRSYARMGPTYVFQCFQCQKEFRHSRNDSALRRHQMPGGFGYCGGRRGYLLRVDS